MILGVDPGLGGALAWLREDGSLYFVTDMPVLDGEVSAALLLGDEHIGDLIDDTGAAVIEWPGIMPKNGAKTARSMGMSLATIHTFCVVKQIPTFRVAPGVWKRRMGLSADKEQSRHPPVAHLRAALPAQERRRPGRGRAARRLLAHTCRPNVSSL